MPSKCWAWVCSRSKQKKKKKEPWERDQFLPTGGLRVPLLGVVVSAPTGFGNHCSSRSHWSRPWPCLTKERWVRWEDQRWESLPIENSLHWSFMFSWRVVLRVRVWGWGCGVYSWNQRSSRWCIVSIWTERSNRHGDIDEWRPTFSLWHSRND